MTEEPVSGQLIARTFYVPAETTASNVLIDIERKVIVSPRALSISRIALQRTDRIVCRMWKGFLRGCELVALTNTRFV